MSYRRRARRAGLAAVIAAGVALPLTSLAPTADASGPVTPGHPSPASTGQGPEVVHTGKGPTGYEVTFRFKAASASSVQIKGEWSFADPRTIAPASTATTVAATPGLSPSQWRPGDFPIASPNSTAANWPVSAMKKGRDGVWTYTTPLPSGVFTYGFFVDCASATQTGCAEVPDPGNLPWNVVHGQAVGSAQTTSQVYVPSDPRFGTVDYSGQAPARRQGSLTDVGYTSPGHVTPAGTNRLAIYTPPGYDPHRRTPYPTLYLSHGGGGNEVDWSTQGDLRNIMDNLIATGQIQPMVVVMPNNNGYPATTDNSAYIDDLAENVIPYVQDHYRVSDSAAQRAFSGLSAGGIAANNIMLHDTAVFGYYGVMSAGIPSDNTTLTPDQVAALKKVSLYVGGGWQDPVHAAGYMGNDTGTAQEVGILASAGLTVTPDFVSGGHEWYVWRILLKDFLTRVAFYPPAGS